MESINLTNFMIYYNNLSIYYVTSIFVSIVAIVCSWFFHFKKIPVKDGLHERERETEPTRGDDKLTCEETRRIVEEQIDAVISDSLKPLLQKNTKDVIDKIAKEMTDEQLQQEKEVEQQQLSAILELLKDQEDKFQVGSMEELEDQLKLYR